MWYVIFYIVRKINAIDKYKEAVFFAVSIVTFFCLREIKAEQSFSFLTGIIFSEKKEIQKKVFKPRSGFILIMIGLSCLATKQLPIIRSGSQTLMKFVQLGIKLPCGLGSIILLYVFLLAAHDVDDRNITNVLYGIGLISYELYLIHGYVLTVISVSWIGAIVFILLTGTVSFVYWWVLKLLRPYLFKVFRVYK